MNKNTLIYRALKPLIVILFVTMNISLFAQNDYSFFKYSEPFSPDSTGNYYFALDNVNFFKNNEFHSNVATGYTLPGAWIRPKIVYYPNKKLKVEFGGHVLKFNGREEYFNLTPWFNAVYMPTSQIAITIGNLNTDGNHGLIEPLMEPERFLTAKPEAGIELKYNSAKFTGDFWIDWQQYIVQGDPLKERFAFGTILTPKLMETNNMVLTFPVSFTGLHIGGEIDTNPDPVKTYIAVSPGLSLKKMNPNGAINEWGIDTHYAISTYPANIPVSTDKKGWGFYSAINMNTRLGGITASYWYGHKFYTPQGGQLYQCMSKTDHSMLADNRIINLKYHYVYAIMENTNFGFIYDYYYDTITKKNMSSQGLYLIINFAVIPRKKVALP